MTDRVQPINYRDRWGSANHGRGRAGVSQSNAVTNQVQPMECRDRPGSTNRMP
jgi:hypothetical protein